MTRTEVINLLEKYSMFLEQQGYTDTDWRTEPPFAIDEFLKGKEFKKLQIHQRVDKKKGVNNKPTNQ
jgi:hypothetical protein